MCSSVYKNFKLAEKDVVIHQLYEILEKLWYPEVAQNRFEEFESTILVGTKRLDLLNWLLQKSPGFNSSFLNKFKESTLEDKLCKCYSQIGLCSDDNILLGKCTIDKQLSFLNLLILFIKNVHLAPTDFLVSEKQTVNHLFKEATENIDPNKSNTNTHENNPNINIIVSLETTEVLTDNYGIEKHNLDNLCLNVKESIKELSEQKIDSCEPILENFNTSFKKVVSLSTPPHSNEFSEHYNDLYTDMQNIHTAFSIVNKTMNNKIKIKNRTLPENSTKTMKPLTQIIKNNLVLIEQACNMFKET